MSYTPTDLRRSAPVEPPASRRRMPRAVGWVRWAAVSVLGAYAVSVLASDRGEAVSSMWMVTAAVCIYLIGYRFYASFLAAKVMALDNRRAPPTNGAMDAGTEPTNKWIVFGQHFAAIAGPGPLVGSHAGGAVRLFAGSVVDRN